MVSNPSHVTSGGGLFRHPPEDVALQVLPLANSVEFLALPIMPVVIVRPKIAITETTTNGKYSARQFSIFRHFIR